MNRAHLTVREAREAARAWVDARRRAHPQVVGAFLSGSALCAQDTDVLPEYSDVDITLVVDADEVPAKIGKLRVDGVLLDIGHRGLSTVLDVDTVRRTYFLAPSFAGPEFLADPLGYLERTRRAVAPTFREPTDVTMRCADVLQRSRSRLADWRGSNLPEEVLAWIFPASLLTQAPIVAALEPPTVRRRYVAALDVLRRHGHADLGEDLLENFGCRDAEAATVRDALGVLTAELTELPHTLPRDLPFASDLEPAARPVVVDGTRKLLEEGRHREAVFWIVVTAARAQQATGRCSPWFRDLLANLTGITSTEDVRPRATQAQQLADRVERASRAIVAG